MMMNAEVKEKWTTALRSGDYKQAAGRLKTKKNGQTVYCCLGVLCEVENLIQIKHFHRNDVFFEYEDQMHEIVLPTNFRMRINLCFNDERTLIGMNDRGDSFEKIADWIDKNC